MPYYGQNGFYLPFKNNASTTTLGWDYSGDTTAKYNATVAGNAQISTAQSKFGGSSALFDGNGDYLQLNGSSDYAFGTGDFTIEFWVRFAAVGVDQAIYDSRPTATSGIYTNISLSGSVNKIGFNVNNSYVIISTTVFTTNTWYHIAVSRSGTSAKLFINGTQEGSTYTDSNNYLNPASRPFIGGNGYAANSTLNGYIDDLRIYKGVAKYTSNFTAPTSALPLGSSDTNWQYCVLAMPMDGANASTTFPIYAPNKWTTNNFSVTAGSGNDSVIDVPTRYGDGSNNRGNYCTWNPAFVKLGAAQSGNLSNGNLVVTANSTNHRVAGTLFPSSGKWYFEITINSSVGIDTWIGVCDITEAASKTLAYRSNAQYYDGTNWLSYGSSYTNGNVISVAYDINNKSIEFFKNGVSQGVKTSTAIVENTGPIINLTASNEIMTLNCGQQPFAYTPPAGFKALNTFNLP